MTVTIDSIVTIDSSGGMDGAFGTGGPDVRNATFDVYDNLNGTALLEWGNFCPGADTYNVYVNDVFSAGVSGLIATVSGLQFASYNAATGVVTPALTYRFRIVGSIQGVESAQSVERAFTPEPTSVMLATPMKRLWPFPNTGLD